MSPIAVLHAAGSPAMGVGHLSRTATLAVALKQTQAWKRVILLWETPADLAHHFAPIGCELLQVPDRNAALEVRSRLLAADTSLSTQRSQHVLITDLLDLTPSDFADARTQGFQRIAHLNDSGSGRFNADLLVDEDGFKSASDLPRSFKGTGLVGNTYRLIRPSIRQLRPSQPWQGARVERVLLTLGGADPANLTLEFVQGLCHADAQLPFWLTVVVGPAFDSRQVNALIAIAQSYSQITVVHSPQCMGKLMVEHDIVITLGGISTYEALCLGRPCAAISWNFMAPYVEALSQIGFIENLGNIGRSPVHLLRLIGNRQRLQQFAQAGWTSIDGQGADRVAGVIFCLTF